MVLPLVKLWSLAFRTLSKPIAARLKHNAGIHPKFCGFIIGLAQVLLFTVALIVQSGHQADYDSDDEYIGPKVWSPAAIGE